MSENRYTHLLWDFNGTVYDDLHACLDSVNFMLAERALPTLTAEGYREIFDFPVCDYYAKAGFDFEKEPFSVLAPLWVAEYQRRSRVCTVYSGVREVMEEVHARGIRQEILSATEAGMLEGQLRSLGICHLLDGWNGINNIHAAGKEALAIAWRDAHPTARVLFVGDTTHDAHVAALMGADCVLFEGGHMSRRRLEACGLPIISHMEELLAYL